ncbi:hypothetical protein BVX94_01260 [bacterium B17]|nr:hypothetical protein BVX94_01260 [bacterium B17]
MGKHIAIFIAVLIMTAGFASAGITETNAVGLTTTNDLQESWFGGTKFDNGVESFYSKGNDNNVDSEAYWHASYSNAICGVYNLPKACRLGSIALTTKSGSYGPVGSFKIQGSTNTTTGFDGDWVDIFYPTGLSLADDYTYLWKADFLRYKAGDNAFDNGYYTAFRYYSTHSYAGVAEIEFFATPSPHPTVIIVK